MLAVLNRTCQDSAVQLPTHSPILRPSSSAHMQIITVVAVHNSNAQHCAAARTNKEAAVTLRDTQPVSMQQCGAGKPLVWHTFAHISRPCCLGALLHTTTLLPHPAHQPCSQAQLPNSDPRLYAV